MPLHDWSQAPASDFHSFLHHGWIWQLMKYLNKVALPDNYIAMAERRIGPYIADVVTMEEDESSISSTTLDLSPTLVIQAPVFTLVSKHISIYDKQKSKMVAVIEVVSPGNKNSKEKVELFIEKSVDYLATGIHYIVIDPLSPTRFVTHFIKEILSVIRGGELLVNKPLYAASFACIYSQIKLYCKEFAVGEFLPEIPVFLTHNNYVLLNLEKTYHDTISDIPDSVIPHSVGQN